MKPTVQIVRNHRRPKNVSEINVDARTLELIVTYNRKPRYFAANGSLKISESEFKNKHLKKYKEAYEEVMPAYSKALEIIDKLGDSFSFESFSRDYKRIIRGELSSAYDMRSVFSEYVSDTDRTLSLSDRTISAYQTTLNWLIKFKKNSTIVEITAEMVAKFDSFLRKQNAEVSQNTINAYFRNLKAIYNYAVDKGYVEDTKPFKKYPLTSTRKGSFHHIFVTNPKVFASYHFYCSTPNCASLIWGY